MFKVTKERTQPPPEAEGRRDPSQTSPVDDGDADGWVLERYYSDLSTSTLAVTTWEFYKEGYRWFPQGRYVNLRTMQVRNFEAGEYWNEGGWEAYIWYNQGRMNASGAGPTDWAETEAHERAHALGWHHWEGSPEVNAAYYPDGPLCQC